VHPPRLFDNPGLLLGVAAAIMLAVALGGYFALPLVFGARDAIVPTPTVTPVPVTIGAPAAALLAPVPTPTPIVAAAGEKLLLVAPFVGYTSEDLRYNVAGRIEEALEQEIHDLQLANVRVAVLPSTVAAQGQAHSLLADTRALVVIWGEYDAGRVRANVTTPGDGDTNWVNPVDSPAKLSLVINEDVPNAARALALFALGRAYRDEQDLPTALRILEQALALKPQDPTTLASLHFYIGILLPKVRGLEVSVLTEAIDHFSAALVLQPQWENLQYNRGTNYLGRALLSLAERADLDAAIADLSAVVQKQPRGVDPRLNLGIALYQRNAAGDLDTAIANFDQVIALAPADARGYYHRGLARIRAGGSDGWRDDLLAAKARNPQNTAADTGLCWGLALAGEAEAALPFCDAAVAADPTGSSFDGRAIAYSDLGRYADAAADLKQYLLWVQADYPELYAKYHGPEAEQWIAALERGENPFTPEVRAALR
jgi:tetratricopeptide (TPR) repeat protein